jgi:hypothetical protein
MKKEMVLGATGRQYAAAYEAHYTTKDLGEALLRYKGITVESPDSVEAGYCRMQIQNIMNAVVPKEELADAQWHLALRHVPDRQ